MSVPFSEDLWQRLSGLWRRDKKEEEEAVGYDDPQLKQMLDVMMVSRRSMKAAEKQKYDIDRGLAEGGETDGRWMARTRLVQICCGCDCFIFFCLGVGNV